MGIAERRIQQQFADKDIPEALKYYSEQTGGATANLKIEIDWATFGDDKRAHENFSLVWLQPLQGVEAVCGDATGKSAIKDGLKKIVIKNGKEASVEVKDGVMTATLNAADGSSGGLGWTEYQKALENAL